MEDQERARQFGTRLYGADFTILAVDAAVDRIETGGYGICAVVQPIPPEMLSRTTRLRAVRRTDPEDKLFFFGPDPYGEDTSARFYKDFHGRGFAVVRYDGVAGRPYSLQGPFERDGSTRTPMIRIGGMEVFGSGLDWKSLEALLDGHVGEDIERLRGLPRIRFFPPEESEAETDTQMLLSGLCGAVVEIFYVPERQVASWGGDVKDEGWHWSRQDVYAIHGPFGNSEQAYEAVLDVFGNGPRSEETADSPGERRDVMP